MIAQALSLRGWKLFSGIVLVELLILLVSQTILIDEIVFFNTYSEQLTYELSMEIFSAMRSYSWISYAITPILLLLKFSALSVLIYIGVFFSDLHKDITLGKIFKVVVVSEIVFVVASVIKMLWFILFAGNYTLDDMNFFYPLSLINLFSRSEVASYWVYPLQTVNIFQVFYVLLLAFGLSRIGSVKKISVDRIVLSTYVPAMAVWIAMILFLTIDTMP
ncbi:MAG: hypothetical protein IPI37_03895 [Bacteroidales bacterium]|jgi:hypothetical protein|nr:hypothetical protein [Bacteroidales bacterium]HQP78139.1 hypothetical protein [Saprospiraceae bacterium]MBP7036945.1 hypothetical protein [Bacteroidales bacterium]MZP67014.1 hypothetical protein [Bacteroidales bacterium]HPY68162.1 hypothetical protein [Bacteroidales bacterium]